MFEDFFGNTATAEALADMVRQQRIPQTLLLAGPEGVGKATLARRFASALLHESTCIEKDDLSKPDNVSIIAEREKWPADKRNEDPLLFASNPDFVTFAPDGPLRQITIQQMRALKQRAPFQPLRGRWRIFLIDQIDRANEQAANSLLKILEEPPEHLLLVATAANAYDLLPTIRSRSLIFQLAPLSPDEMRHFAATRKLKDVDRRVALAVGSPGLAVSLDLEVYDRRRAAMLALLQAASGKTQFSTWMKHSESLGAARSEKLDHYLKVLYMLLEDILILQQAGGPARNLDIVRDLEAIAAQVGFEWIRCAVKMIDELVEMVRRNIQKSIALDALVMRLREKAA